MRERPGLGSGLGLGAGLGLGPRLGSRLGLDFLVRGVAAKGHDN